MIKLFSLILGTPKKQEFPLRPGSVNKNLRALYKPRQEYRDSMQTFRDSNMVFQDAMGEFLSS